MWRVGQAGITCPIWLANCVMLDVQGVPVTPHRSGAWNREMCRTIEPVFTFAYMYERSGESG
jgi:hypothetical protein